MKQQYCQNDRVILVNPHADEGFPKALIIEVKSYRPISPDGDILSFMGVNVDDPESEIEYHSSPIGPGILTPTYFMTWSKNDTGGRAKTVGYYEAQDILDRFSGHTALLIEAQCALDTVTDFKEFSNYGYKINEYMISSEEIVRAIDENLKGRFSLDIERKKHFHDDIAYFKYTVL